MFQGVIDAAKSSASALLAEYAARASVAVPFLIALGFATSALTVYLMERFGAISAYLIVAAGFTAIGVIGAIAFGVKEQEEEPAELQSSKDGNCRCCHRCRGASRSATSPRIAGIASDQPNRCPNSHGRDAGAGAQSAVGDPARCSRRVVLAQQRASRSGERRAYATEIQRRPNRVDRCGLRRTAYGCFLRRPARLTRPLRRGWSPRAR